MGPFLELMRLQLRRKLGQNRFQGRAVPERVLASRCGARLARRAAAVLKNIVLLMISFRTVEAGEDNWCHRRTGTEPAEPERRPSAET